MNYVPSSWQEVQACRQMVKAAASRRPQTREAPVLHQVQGIRRRGRQPG